MQSESVDFVSGNKREAPVRPGRSLALIGAGWGPFAGLALGGMRIALSDLPLARVELIGDAAFLAVYLTPFVLALIAARWTPGGRQAGV